MSDFYNSRRNAPSKFVTTNSIKMRAIILLLLLAVSSIANSQKNLQAMKMNPGIVTENLAETKKFYTEVLDFGISFENEFYVLLHTPDRSAEISFLQANHPSQQPVFQPPFEGKGMYLTIEVEDVDDIYKHLKGKGVPIEIGLRDEPWGDRHFAIVDPNGIGIDIVTYTSPGE